MGGSRGTRLAGVALCVVAVGATAIAGATTKKDSGTVNDKTEAFTAKCPKGERVEVGGFRTTVNDDSGILIEDLLFKGSNRWRATFDGLGQPAPAAAIAYCGKTPRLTKETASETAPTIRLRRGDPQPLTATAKCPQGKTVQLGGFAVVDEGVTPAPRGGPNSGFLPASMKAVSARKWRVSGVARFPGVKLTAVAGCADLPAPSSMEKTEPVSDSGSSSAKAKCPSGEEVVMGGFEQTPFDGSGPYIRGLKRPNPRVWKATTREFDQPASLTAIAYCA